MLRLLILMLSWRSAESFSTTPSSSVRQLLRSHGLPSRLCLSNNENNMNPIEHGLESLRNSMGFQRSQFPFNVQQAQADGFGTRARNAAINATVGDILVPLCSNIEMRQELAQQGIYAGVEYKVCALQLAGEEEEEVKSLKGMSVDAKQGVVALVQPAYKLRTHLERNDWPVSVPLEAVPIWLSKATYEAGTAVGTLFLSGSFLVVAATIAFFIRFVAVPTPSMVPALNPGNIILVTRSFPVPFLQPKVGDVVFFDAPTELEVAARKFASEQSSSSDVITTKGKQFVKRVVAVPGESVGVKQSEPYVKLSDSQFRLDVIGPYARQEVFDSSSWDRPPTKLQPKEYFVAGDNGYRSVDSRVWGPLKEKYIIGTAKWVLWPVQDFGPVSKGQISEVTKPQN